MKPSTSLVLFLVLQACTAVRPIGENPSPESIRSYLRSHPGAALRLTDSTGQARWVYDITVNGDTLRGSRSSTMPRLSVAVSLRDITQVGAPRFSTTRTLGLIGGILTVAAIFAFTTPGATY
jgi:hypothetical protein